MKIINWNIEKNQILIKERNISFEDVLFAIQHFDLLDDIKHPNGQKYPNQRIFIVNINGYAYMVPYVETADEIFLKTIIPSLKATGRYLWGRMDKIKLDQEEQEILDAFAADEFESVLTDERKEYLAQVAEQTVKKDKRINIRISSKDLSAIQRRALKEGLPYQSLVASILHKYVSGGLQDIDRS